ncbi:MAG: RNA polymerase sigma factor SigZ [Vicinamibacteria bacterium]|nr:RNA polymerase sigma factor SigZ [Vicinamibacteria bacterium]MBP9945038.1 RNA polymerase sigma factor SigZ [Vicinamibacteria bacterium]
MEPATFDLPAKSPSESTLEVLIPKLRGFLSRRISNPADVDDLTQEILLRMHQNAGSLSDVKRIHGWIWQIARNAVIDHYRRRRPTVDIDSLNLDVEAKESSDIQELVLTWLAPTIEELPEPYRDAMRLSEIEGLTQAEVASRLSLSLSGAKSRIQRGRVKLREALQACCHFDFNDAGRIVGFRPRGGECVRAAC